MGVIASTVKYKTKAIIEIFLWHFSLQKFTVLKCSEISEIRKKFDSDFIDSETFDLNFSMPLELIAKDNKIEIRNLQILFLLLTNDNQGNRIELFKEFTDYPEDVINFFRFKYELIFSRIPNYLIKNKLLDPAIAENFIQRKSKKILELSNLRYSQYTTSSCNVLKLTMLKR